MTPELLDSIIDCGVTRAKLYAKPLTAAMEEFEINTPKRQAAFLAQIGHESGSLAYVRELWGPTPAQRRYEGREDLGNTERGDGFRFRGRGFIQITGRANYEAVGKALGVDLILVPWALEHPITAARSAAWFWKEKGCNELADSGRFEQITYAINGGYNGQEDRMARWNIASEAFGTLA